MLSAGFTESDHKWMQRALALAREAESLHEVPVGAVLVVDDKILGEGFNCPISHSDPTAHAEIMALRAGANTQKNYRLVNSTLYVTLEPCVMCVGAIIHARVKRLVFGALDAKGGAVISAFQLLDTDKLNHKVEYAAGLLKQDCGSILTQFFKAKRQSL
jgi:tRNA(adenine34) deaminase